MAGDQLGQVRLEERDTSGGQRLDLGRQHVDPEDLVPELGHAGRVGGAEVAGADD
jgi:hypothetical protein